MKTPPGQPKLFDAQAIIDFAIDVSRISVALLYPGGISREDIAKQRESGPFVSRGAIRMLAGGDESST